MYIPELDNYTKYSSLEIEKNLNIVAVGWIDSDHPYNTGDVSREFINRLEVFCSNPLIRVYGIEMCPICKKLETVTIKLSSGEEISLFGAYGIRIPSDNGKKIYASSDFIIHYIVAHQYKPPQEFIDAVLSAPLPGTSEYDLFVKPWEKYH